MQEEQIGQKLSGGQQKGGLDDSGQFEANIATFAVATQFKQITQDLQLRDVQVRRSRPFPLCERWCVCARALARARVCLRDREGACGCPCVCVDKCVSVCVHVRVVSARARACVCVCARAHTQPHTAAAHSHLTRAGLCARARVFVRV